MMNWDDLRFVLAASRAGTMSGAAERLHVTHTTVSRRLRACEELLGVRLFDRTPDGLRPTDAGQELAALAARMESEVSRAEAHVLGQDQVLEGTLRVSTFDSLYLLCHDAYAAFIERHPSVELVVTAEMQHVSLSRREADIVVRLTNSPPPGLVGRRVGHLTFAPFASPALIARVGADAPLSAYPWLSFDPLLGLRWMDELIASYAPDARIVARIDDNTMLIRAMLQRGLGVFFLPSIEGPRWGLEQVGPAATEHRFGVWMLTLPDLQHNSRVRAFLDLMGERLPAMLAEPDQNAT